MDGPDDGGRTLQPPARLEERPLARKPNTYERRAARQRAATRPAAIGLGLAFLTFSGSLAWLLAQAVAAPSVTASPERFAATVTLGAVLALGAAGAGALALWEARP